MKFLALPFSWLYALIISCRNIAFDLGILNMEDVGVPVISVGNMTMGGTGKTPLVEYIVRVCLARGRKVAVVSRGYGRESNGIVVVSDGRTLLVNARRGGDEPVQIARKFPEAVVVVGERRVEAARQAVRQLGADVVVLDDGFQHRYIRRGLDIVVLDARKDLATLRMIPAGERREPLNSLGRAGLVAFSRADESSANSAWMNRMSGMLHGREVRYRYAVDRIFRVGSENQFSPIDLRRMKLLLFSGIGDHDGFAGQMERVGVDVVGGMKFPDHHPYVKSDLVKIFDGITRKRAEAVLTTEKDFVRLSGNTALIDELVQRCPVYYVTIVIDVVQGKNILDSMIDKCLVRRTAS